MNPKKQSIWLYPVFRMLKMAIMNHYCNQYLPLFCIDSWMTTTQPQAIFPDFDDLDTLWLDARLAGKQELTTETRWGFTIGPSQDDLVRAAALHKGYDDFCGSDSATAPMRPLEVSHGKPPAKG